MRSRKHPWRPRRVLADVDCIWDILWVCSECAALRCKFVTYPTQPNRSSKQQTTLTKPHGWQLQFGETAWRLQLSASAIPAIPILFTVLLCPESPYWHMKHNRNNHDQAFRSLNVLRNTPLQAARELYYVHLQQRQRSKLETDDETRSFGKKFIELFSIPRNRRATIAAYVVMLSQQLCGSMCLHPLHIVPEKSLKNPSQPPSILQQYHLPQLRLHAPRRPKIILSLRVDKLHLRHPRDLGHGHAWPAHSTPHNPPAHGSDHVPRGPQLRHPEQQSIALLAAYDAGVCVLRLVQSGYGVSDLSFVTLFHPLSSFLPHLFFRLLQVPPPTPNHIS